MSAAAFEIHTGLTTKSKALWASARQPEETAGGSRINSYILTDSNGTSNKAPYSHIGNMVAKVVRAQLQAGPVSFQGILVSCTLSFQENVCTSQEPIPLLQCACSITENIFARPRVSQDSCLEFVQVNH